MIFTFAAFATTLNKMRKFIDQWIVADDQEALLVAQRRAALDPAVIAAEVRPDSMFTARPTAAPHPHSSSAPFPFLRIFLFFLFLALFFLFFLF